MTAPKVTVIGRLTADPELRFTPSGAAVVNFTVAANDRYKKDDEWQDKPAVFLRCNAWREFAENIAESLTKGTEVVVTGTLSQREWEDREGNRRVAVELEVDAVGPNLARATAQVKKADRAKAAAGDGGGW